MLLILSRVLLYVQNDLSKMQVSLFHCLLSKLHTFLLRVFESKVCVLIGLVLTCFSIIVTCHRWLCPHARLLTGCLSRTPYAFTAFSFLFFFNYPFVGCPSLLLQLANTFREPDQCLLSSRLFLDPLHPYILSLLCTYSIFQIISLWSQ